MKVTYDSDSDAVYIALKDEPFIKTSHKIAGLIVDYAQSGEVIGIEVLQASLKISDLSGVEFALTA